MTTQPSSIESTNEIYQTRVDALEEADNKDRDAAAQAEADSGLESVEQPLSEEARFVDNPAELRKGVDSEEKFAPDEGAETSTKKVAEKKPAAKK